MKKAKDRHVCSVRARIVPASPFRIHLTHPNPDPNPNLNPNPEAEATTSTSACSATRIQVLYHRHPNSEEGARANHYALIVPGTVTGPAVKTMAGWSRDLGATRKYHVWDPPGDGHCFFKCVAHFLKLSNYREVRANVAAYMRAHKEHFEQFVLVRTTCTMPQHLHAPCPPPTPPPPLPRHAPRQRLHTPFA